MGVNPARDHGDGPIEEGCEVSVEGLAAATELRALLAELAVASVEMGVSDGTIELVLGLAPGALYMDLARPAFTRGAEAQLRRLLEVSRLARLLIGSAGVPDWLRTADPRLGHSTPIRTMQRPGGLLMVRDLLRDEWEEFVEGAVFEGRSR